MDWLGKSYARLLAIDEAKTFLQEDEEHNKKEINKNSENLLIKGDNLEVLKHLTNAYYEKIKMIYIDPPYNTGNDGFVYSDNRKFTVKQLQDLAGLDEEKAKRILEFTNSKSNSHSAWLTFMYPRLYIAKQLLKDDGVIFVSIDDNEVSQLRLLMDEVFGEDNFIGNFIWQKQGNDNRSIFSGVKTFRNDHESIIVYSKNKSNIKFNRPKENSKFKNDYGNIDNDPRGNWMSAELGKSDARSLPHGKNYYTLTSPNGTKWTRQWNFSKKEMEDLISENKVYFGKNGDNVPRLKKFLNENNNKIPSSLLVNKGSTKVGQSELDDLFDGEKIFSYPKPSLLIKHLINLSYNESKDDLILDFFSGSGTTADAVMQLNAEDGGNRKFIMVQLPEIIDKKKNKIAYDFVKEELKIEEPTIFEITKERIIRAAKKIQTDNSNAKEPKDLSNQDFGFKIFETIPNDQGNWENLYFDSDNFEPKLEFLNGSLLTKKDIKNLLITWKTYDGMELTKELEKIDLENYTAYYGNNKLYLIESDFKTENLKNILEKIDSDKTFKPTSIIAFGYNFESKCLRGISENIKSYSNRKNIDIDFITRW